jgi:hypothetical protein
LVFQKVAKSLMLTKVVAIRKQKSSSFGLITNAFVI